MHKHLKAKLFDGKEGKVGHILETHFRALKEFAHMQWLKIKYFGIGGYNAKKYWRDRLSHYGTSLKGVGNKYQTEQQNKESYEQAKKTFLSLCKKEKVDFSYIRFLDVGCGAGFYAQLFSENGGRNYTGVDITDSLFATLRAKFSRFHFIRLDVTEQPLPGIFDVIIMIDVTQHITTAEKFSYAMQNIGNHLGEGGVFIVTSWLKGDIKRGFYEVSRSLQRYKREFPGYAFSDPLPFRDKFLFLIRKDNH